MREYQETAPAPAGEGAGNGVEVVEEPEMAVGDEAAVATALLAEVFGTLAIALEDVLGGLSQDVYVTAETNLSRTLLRQHLLTLATLDTV